MGTNESKKPKIPLRFEELRDILKHRSNELSVATRQHLVQKMEAVAQARTSFLSEEARSMVEECKLKAKHFEIIIEESVKIGIVSEKDESVQVEIFEEPSDIIEEVAVKYSRQPTIGVFWNTQPKRIESELNYTTVEHFIEHCFSIFTCENIAVTVERPSTFFSVERLKKLIKNINPTNSCSWTHLLFARRSLKIENFNQIITLRRNLFENDNELREILSLKSNCITLGEVSKRILFTGLKFEDLTDLDTYGFRWFGSTMDIMDWNLFLQKWFNGGYPRLGRMYIWFDVKEVKTDQFLDPMMAGLRRSIISRKRINELSVKLIGGMNVSINRNFIIKLKRNDGSVAEITTLTSPILGIGFAFKVIEQDQ